MKAIQIQTTGGPEVLQPVELPVPQPAAGEALVRIEAAGVNFIDTYLREGRYPVQLPFVPGQEAAGVIAALGPEVSGLAVGERVAWAGVNGTYAEFAAVPASQLLPIPTELTTEQAAAVLLQGLTAHYLAHDTYAIQPGETVLVHAAAGGVGLLLTQMAAGLGARVIATVSSEEKAELARGAGAAVVVRYTEQSFLEAVMRETRGEGVPVVYDSVGRTTFEDSLAALRTRGLLVLYGASSGAVPPLDPIRLMAGSKYLTRPTMKDYVATREALLARAAAVFAAVAEGRLQVHIGARFPLSAAGEAHRALAGRQTTGKVLLTVA